MSRQRSSVPRHRQFADPSVTAVYDAFPPALRARLLRLRELIFEVAAQTEGVGAIEETLKWGQPSYLTSETGSGTTVRIDRVQGVEDEDAIFVHCQTDLIDRLRERYPEFRFDGKRAVRFRVSDSIDEDAVRHSLALALTYHRRKRAA